MNKNACHIDDVLEARKKGIFDPEKYCYDKDCGRPGSLADICCG